MTGLTLAHYRIDAELGRGGMGIVYKATDTKLNRTVALKVLPAAALASEDDRARFFREAQSAAQLHHPNIATVFGIDEAIPVKGGKEPQPGTESRLFIAMEFIEGETVSERIKKAPLPLTEAVSIAGQVAEALKEAHGKDIVHRDIKSANVMLTGDGIAKVLDFGLAKTNQSTMLTRMGSTLGTVAYMSPEQARGQEVDGRTDLYALGTMLYEMVAGRLPFAGDYEQAVLYSILNEPPEPLTALRTGVPMDMERVVSKLLAKEAEYRYQSAAGLLADLKSLDLTGSGHSRRAMTSAVGTLAAPARKPVLPIRTVSIAVATLLIGAMGAWLLKPAPVFVGDTTVRSLTLELPGFQSIGGVTPSEDGRLLAVSGEDTTGRNGIHLLEIETGRARLLVEGQVSATNISPDGTLLAYWQAGDLYTVPVSGGTPVKVADQASRATSWTDDNSLVFVNDTSLWLLPGDGSPVQRVTDPDSTRIHQPSVLPGGQAVVFCAYHSDDPREHLEIVNLESGERTSIGYGTRPRYLSSGHLIFGDPQSGVAGPLFARPFNLSTGEFTGPQVGLFENAPVWLYAFDGHGTFYDRLFRASQNVVPRISVHRYSAEGEATGTVLTGPGLEALRISPTDSRIAVTVEDGADDFLMIYDPETDVELQITFSQDEDNHAWSADGERIMLERKGPLEIWSTRGLGLLETIPLEGVAHFDWSPDGLKIVYRSRGVDGLRIYDLDTQRDTVFESRPAYEPRFSPNGKFVAYTLETDGLESAVVRSVSDNTFVRLSIRGGQSLLPKWSADGRSIYAWSEGEILQIPVQTAEDFSQVGQGETVLADPRIEDFEVDGDGSLFVLSVGAESGGLEPGDVPRVSVIINWFEQIKRLAPPSP